MRRCSFQCSHSFIGLLCQQELERKPLREQLYGGSGTVAVFSHKNQNHIAQTATEEGICWSLVLITELYDEKSWLIYQLNVGKKAKICIPVNFLEKNRAQRLVLVQFCNCFKVQSYCTTLNRQIKFLFFIKLYMRACFAFIYIPWFSSLVFYNTMLSILTSSNNPNKEIQ